MEHKSWLWRRKSSEMTITANEKFYPSRLGTEQEKEKILELERSLEELNEQLSCMHIESNAKDDLLAKQVKVAEEAISGLEEAKAETESFQKELADAILKKESADEQILSIDAALKECTLQLLAVKKEHQRTVKDAATNISRVQDNAQVMEKRLAETNNKLAKLAVENSNLSRILEVKEKLIEDLTKFKSQIESSFNQLEEDNTSLRYEVCMLQKELEIRNQDRDFHVKSADAAHKQHLESIRKITKLESECQRLRSMVRRRLPGPAAIAKMRGEVEILANNTLGTKRNNRIFSSVNDCSSHKRVASPIERLHAIEDENKVLKETLAKKDNELWSMRVMFERTASKLSKIEIQVMDFLQSQNSLALISPGGGDEDAINCSESWASALISELEHFKKGKAIIPSGTSELCLMDDFFEMEKLAIVCVDKQSESTNINIGERIPPLSPNGIATGKEIILVNTFPNLQPSPSDLDRALGKIIEVILGIIKKSFTNNNGQKILAGNGDYTRPHNMLCSPAEHVARIFLWEKSELCNVLQQFVVVCNDLLQAKTDFKKFICELAVTLEWIIQHCFPIQQGSTVEETVKNLFNGDSEFESRLNEVNRRLISEMREVESKKKESEERLQPASAKDALLSSQSEESGAKISNLHAQLMTLKCSNSLMVEQIENQKLIAEDLSTQLTVANAELNEARRKLCSLEAELEGKSNSCKELVATSLELQLQLASVATKETPRSDRNQGQKQLRTDWEISAASEKLAECQATILDLGKQLKALASSKDAPLFDQVTPPPSAMKINQLSRLLDQAQDEDEAAMERLTSPKMKEITCAEIKQPPLFATSENNPNAGLLYGRTLWANAGNGTSNAVNPPSPVKSHDFNKRKGENYVGKLVLVHKRQRGGVSFLRKLLSRREKGSSKNRAVPIAS